MSFFARVVAAPPELGGVIGPVDVDSVHAPQFSRDKYSEHARVAIVFVEQPGEASGPVRPDQLLPPHDASPPSRNSDDARRSEQLYWRLVSTDSCEAAHCGALLALRALLEERRIAVTDSAGGSPVVAYGMLNAMRVEPFTRHVMMPRAGCHVTSPGSNQQLPMVIFREPPREAAYGGAMHQLVWIKFASGHEIIMDFTGPQYGIEERLPSTDTPFWRADVTLQGEGRDASGRIIGSSHKQAQASSRRGPTVVNGLELLDGQMLRYDAKVSPDSPISSMNQMHAYIASWIRDSALGVLDHRRGF